MRILCAKVGPFSSCSARIIVLAEGRGRILDQRNVIAEEWTQVWDANERREYARLLANTNPHPLPRFRANGPLSNMAEFAKAFGCKKGDAMVREQACKIW